MRTFSLHFQASLQKFNRQLFKKFKNFEKKKHISVNIYNTFIAESKTVLLYFIAMNASIVSNFI